MADMKFLEARIAIAPLTQARDQAKSEEVQDVAADFANNMASVRCGVELLIGSAIFLVQYENAARKAMEELDPKSPTFRTDLANAVESLTDEIHAAAHRNDQSVYREEQRIIKNLCFVLDRYSYKKDGGTPSIPHEGVTELFRNMIIGTWGAFEVMAGDLWAAALNKKPKGIASLPDADGKMDKTIRLEFLDRENYDPLKENGHDLERGTEVQISSPHQ